MNWNTNPALQGGDPFTSSTTFDAVNRPLTATSPDGSVFRLTFNEGNLLETVDVNLRGAAAATSFVTNIDYNAKGQRLQIAYGNGALTTYDYDPLTFRLTYLRTTRPANADAGLCRSPPRPVLLGVYREVPDRFSTRHGKSPLLLAWICSPLSGAAESAGRGPAA